MPTIPLLELLIVTCSIFLVSEIGIIFGSDGDKPPTVINSDSINIQLVATGFDEPSSFEFVNEQDILITQLEDGKVKLVRDFEVKKYPVLDEDVFRNAQESGLLGITSTVVGNLTHVFLLYTEIPLDDLENRFSFMKNDRIYRYIWDPQGIMLFNDSLVLELPSLPTNNHEAKIAIGDDRQLYIPIDSLSHSELYRKLLGDTSSDNQSYNDTARSFPFLKTNLSGIPITEKGFERSFGLGIRNSWSMAFDPETGQLWSADEDGGLISNINLVNPVSANYTENGHMLPQNVTILNGSHYPQPNLSKHDILPLTSLIFINSTKLGNTFSNDLVAGDAKGNLYHFELNNDRDNLVVNDNLSSHIFATGFGPISELGVGPDQSLYILTRTNNNGSTSSGSLYRMSQDTVDIPPESKAVKADFVWLIETALVLLFIFIFIFIFLKYSRRIWDRINGKGSTAHTR